ncbi:hypothetical protein IEQ34_007318 [Dendrobium chrysotoxum]|uniref:Uncharacterized protein n=1 Tax=Dendrobium chrysotoxum TaxID=161865 RepID=A0AAV7H6D4_DENCH|nr:hypothetical protein IEQ34_007318 [Dendrobium chrysotoxum]
MGVYDGDGSVDVGGVRSAAVETGPAEPEHAGAGEGEEDVVRREALAVLVYPWAHLRRSGKNPTRRI